MSTPPITRLALMRDDRRHDEQVHRGSAKVRRYRLARLTADAASRRERFEYLRRTYD